MSKHNSCTHHKTYQEYLVRKSGLGVSPNNTAGPDREMVDVVDGDDQSDEEGASGGGESKVIVDTTGVENMFMF